MEKRRKCRKSEFFTPYPNCKLHFLLFSLMKTDKTGQERRIVITGTENHRRILNRVSSTELEAGGGNGKNVAGNDRKRQYSPFALSPFSALPVAFLPPWEPLRRRVRKQTIPILIPCDINRCWPFD